MDDEKSITEKLTDAIGKATDSVKSTLGSIVDTASNAAQHAMQSNARRIYGQTVTEFDSGQVYVPAATDAVAMPAPLFATPPAPKPRKPRTKSGSGKPSAAPRKAAAKKSNKKPGKKSAKRPATKSAPGKSSNTSARKQKKSAGKTMAKKAARKPAKARKKSKR